MGVDSRGAEDRMDGSDVEAGKGRPFSNSSEWGKKAVLAPKGVRLGHSMRKGPSGAYTSKRSVIIGSGSARWGEGGTGVRGGGGRGRAARKSMVTLRVTGPLREYGTPLSIN